MMSISSEHIHISIFIYIGCVSISGCWLLSSNYSKFVLLRHWLIHLRVTMKSSLLHMVVVCIKAFICVLYNETVIHRDWSWGGKSLLFFLFFSWGLSRVLLGESHTRLKCCSRILLFAWTQSGFASCWRRSLFRRTSNCLIEWIQSIIIKPWVILCLYITWLIYHMESLLFKVICN